MKKSLIYYLLLLISFGVVSCDSPEAESLGMEFTLTSAAHVTFDADGGSGVITYSITNPISGAVVRATSQAEWITSVDATTAGEVSFVVMPNEYAEERSSHISLAYGSEIRNVAIYQLGYEEPAVEIVAQELVGTYYGERLSEGHGHYWVIIAEDPIVEGAAATNSNYFRLDLVGPLAQDMSNIKIPDGIYEFDPHNSLAEYTIPDIGNTDFVYVDTEGTGWSQKLTSATLSVEGNSFELTATVDGINYHVTYDGDYSMSYKESSDCISTLVRDTVIDVSNCKATILNSGDYWQCGCTDWYIEFVCNDGIYYGTYLVLDLLSNSSTDFTGRYVSAGFSADDATKPDFRAGTFVPGFRVDDFADLFLGSLFMIYEDGKAISQAPLNDGVITIEANGDGTHTIVIDAIDDAEPSHKITLEWRGRFE